MAEGCLIQRETKILPRGPLQVRDLTETGDLRMGGNIRNAKFWGKDPESRPPLSGLAPSCLGTLAKARSSG